MRRVEFGHRETGAVDGDAVAEVDAVEDGFGADFHVESAAIGGAKLVDFAHFLDDSGEKATNCVAGRSSEMRVGGFGEEG